MRATRSIGAFVNVSETSNSAIAAATISDVIGPPRRTLSNLRLNSASSDTIEPSDRMTCHDRPQRRSSRSSAAWLLAAFALAGCGGSTGHSTTAKQVTVPAFDSYPALTITVTPGTPALCRRDAEAFTSAAVGFLRPPPSDLDQYYINARDAFFDFKAHLCDVAILRKPFARVPAKQRREIVRRLSFLGETGHELTKTPQK